MSSQRFTMPFSIYDFANERLASASSLPPSHCLLLEIRLVAYRVSDLQHRSRSRSLVAAHDILEHNIAGRLLFCSQDGSADYGGVLVVGEVLGRLS
jgi:hypothetical protein